MDPYGDMGSDDDFFLDDCDEGEDSNSTEDVGDETSQKADSISSDGSDILDSPGDQVIPDTDEHHTDPDTIEESSTIPTSDHKTDHVCASDVMDTAPRETDQAAGSVERRIDIREGQRWRLTHPPVEGNRTWDGSLRDIGELATGVQEQDGNTQPGSVSTTETRTAETINVYNLTGNTGVKVIHKQGDGMKHSTLMTIRGQSKLRIIQDFDTRLFVKTNAIHECEKQIQQRGMVTITGRSGEGKTVASMYLLKTLSEKESRKPLILTDPSQWDHIPTHQQTGFPGKYTVLIDDMFGRSNLLEGLQTRWEQKLPMMMPLVEAGIVVLVMTFRTNIFSMCKDLLEQYEVFKRCQVVELSSSGRYNKVEREAVLDNHMNIFAKQSKLSVQDRVEIIHSKQLLGFPQCCYLFATNKEMHSKGSVFFTEPMVYLSQCLDSLSKRDPLSYLVLLLLFFYDGSLPLDVLDQFERSRKDKDILDDLLQICLTSAKNMPTMGDLEAKAHSLYGSYLSLNTGQDAFIFLHQSISDTLFLQFCRSHLSKGIQMCSVQTLLEYIRTVSCPGEDWIVLVPEKRFGLLAKRLTEELMSENSSAILTHPAFRDTTFINFLFSSFWDDEVKMLLVLQKNQKYSVRTSLQLSRENLSALKNHHLNITNFHSALKAQAILVFECDSLVAIAILQNAEMLTLYLLQTAKRNQSKGTYSEMIDDILACSFYTGNRWLVSQMIEEGAVLTVKCFLGACFSVMENTPLFELSLGALDGCDPPLDMLQNALLFLIERGRFYNFEHLAELLSNRKQCADILQQCCVKLLLIYHNATPPWFLPCSEQIAKCFNVKDTLTRLHSLGADCSSDECVLLAAGCNDVSALWTVLQCGGNIKCASKGRQTPLHFAALYGSADTMALLLNSADEVDMEAADDNGFTSLHFAAQSLVQSSEKTEILLNRKFKITYRTKCGKTALALTIEAGNIGSMEFLLKANKEQNIESEFPVHIVVRELMHVCMESNSSRSLLHGHLTEHRMKALQLILDFGYSLEDKDEGNITPLHLAVKAGSVSLFQRLLSMVKRTEILPSLLHHSIAHSRFEVFQYLLQKCTDIKDENGNSPIHTAVINMHVDCGNLAGNNAGSSETNVEHQKIFEYILQHDADVNAVNKPGDTPLHLLAQSNFINAVARLVQKGGSTGVHNGSNNIPLHIASKSGNLEVVEYLVEKGTGVSVHGENGDTPLHAACEGGHTKVARYIVELGVDINVLNTGGESPIVVAAKHGHLDIVSYLITQKAFVDKRILTLIPITRVTQNGYINILKKLVQTRDDMKALQKYFNSMMLWAAERNSFDTVKFLYKKGADFNISDRNGETLLHLAAKKGHCSLVRFLVQNGANLTVPDTRGHTPLHMATEQGHAGIVHLIVDGGADVNTKDHLLRLPLHYAASNGAYEMVKYLTEADTDVNAGDRDLKTALHNAAEQGSHDIINYLITKGASLHATDRAGRIPLHVAAKSGNITVVRLFTRNGSQVNLADRNRQIPLHVAARNGHPNIVKHLLQMGAVVNVVDSNGQTPLHGAAKSSQIESVRYLVQRGADIHARDRDSRQPLHIAAKAGPVAAVQLLVEEGGDMHASDRFKKTPLRIASTCNHPDMNRYIKEEYDGGYVQHAAIQMFGNIIAGCNRISNRIASVQLPQNRKCCSHNIRQNAMVFELCVICVLFVIFVHMDATKGEKWW